MQNTNLPVHLGFIMDGNRRWAKAKGLAKYKGHMQGYEVLKNVVRYAKDRKIPFVSFYAFSTENWSRSKTEISFLMDLILKIFTSDLAEFNQLGSKIKWLGSTEKLSKPIIKAIQNAEQQTANNKNITIGLCFNYGGHKELVDAYRKMTKDNVKVKEINEELIAKYLYAPEIPPVDMIVRTSGEQRISNFMLYRSAYSELLFIDKHWPDFNKSDFDLVLTEYSNRQRRFGGSK